MQATKIWKTVTRDTVDFLDELVDVLSGHGVGIPAKANADSEGNANGIPGRRRTVLGA
jgi:hypothetical protein